MLVTGKWGKGGGWSRTILGKKGYRIKEHQDWVTDGERGEGRASQCTQSSRGLPSGRGRGVSASRAKGGRRTGDRRGMRRQEARRLSLQGGVQALGSPAELSGKMDGLRRPCRFQPLCLLEPSPGPAGRPWQPSGGLPGSRLWGQLDAFSRWGWLGFSGCLAWLRPNFLRPLGPF